MSDDELVKFELTKGQFKTIYALCGFTVMNGVIDGYNIESKEDSEKHRDDILLWYQLRDMVNALPMELIKSTMLLIDDTRDAVFNTPVEESKDDNVAPTN
jgi:hypothetical protein